MNLGLQIITNSLRSRKELIEYKNILSTYIYKVVVTGRKVNHGVRLAHSVLIITWNKINKNKNVSTFLQITVSTHQSL